MSPDQLRLIDAPAVKPLTGRQQAVLDAVTNAGVDGIDAADAGAITHALKEGRWAHPQDQRCAYCGRDGQAILARLAELGHVRYRRKTSSLPGGWVATSVLDGPDERFRAMLADDEDLPF